jgi:hypothetical protein
MGPRRVLHDCFPEYPMLSCVSEIEFLSPSEFCEKGGTGIVNRQVALPMFYSDVFEPPINGHD